MILDLNWVTVREITSGYIDNDFEGVFGFNGKLNIRPKYQREFVYDEKKQQLVINSIINEFPLNVMYWVKNKDGGYEILDGQQRTISFCKFVNGDYSTKIYGRTAYFHSLTREEQDKILDYKIAVYFCSGSEKDIIDWFEIINIAGEKLSSQELRNAVYTGDWLRDAKLKFSKPNCGAYLHSKNYVNGSTIRQEILETAISWIVGSRNDDDIRDYMSLHQNDDNADELWRYFQKVIDWVKLTFTTYRKDMKGLDWGYMYDNFNENTYDTAELEKEIASLMIDDDVTKKSGIYMYVLTRNAKYLSLRSFTENQKRQAFEKQNGICPKCGKQFHISEMEADHITPWSKGGKTIPENCQMLCRDCNRRKSDI
jgi:uncharacterized protein with ParB-like and HNH nuclease domain